MSRNIWVISDTHFNHKNIIKYCNRPFYSVDKMNSFMIEKWNSTVKEGDIVYHLGDFWYKEIPNIKLNGRKRLILGNHDNGKEQKLQKLFQKIMVWRMFPEFGLLLTHVPVHPNTLNPNKCPVNIHGHIHNKPSYGVNYKNVSVEVIDYTPVNIEELRVK